MIAFHDIEQFLLSYGWSSKGACFVMIHPGETASSEQVRNVLNHLWTIAPVLFRLQ